MKLKIIVDSSADLPIEMINKHNISIIPLRVQDEFGKEYLDGINLRSNELLLRMKSGEQFKTSLPSYDAIFQTFLNNSEYHCIYLACSADLSGTHNFAQLVKLDFIEKYPNSRIEIIDTRSVSLGIGVLVLELIKDIEKEESPEKILENVYENINKIQHIFTVEDLQYLIRGGRVGRFAGFLGGMLNINPIMEVSEGKFKPLEKIRGRKKALNRIIEIMEIRKNIKKESIGVIYGIKDGSVENFIKKLVDNAGDETILINQVGSAVGVHTGPGALGIFFLSK